MECFDAPVGQCQIYQRILINNGSAIALVATFAWDEARQAMRTQIALPLGIDLEKGATIATDTGYSIAVRLSRCTQQGCLIEGTVPEDLLQAFSRGGSASISVTNPGQGAFAIPLSVKGFAEAMARIRPARAESTAPAALGGAAVAPAPQPAPPRIPAPPDPSAADPEKRYRPVTGNE
nr:invasion associated locus B family protein [Actibacterium sp. MT2.3-13A]